ncbi:MAG: hypothetical protein IPI66_03575 [Chitinophagaceae bacterium]|nr:hypothetical protein [Chitinophagaceae bacterium]MBL0055433.1 hypothetical protein [Chitinophagaceae bacterium]
MNPAPLTGTVSFVNHEKKIITIEYVFNDRKKSITGATEIPGPQHKSGRSHPFHIGDTVSFIPALSGRGDKQVATQVKFLYNSALEVLINKARVDNRFLGYLKLADDQYFVKEIDSYLFFPVPFSPWQVRPTEKELNEPVAFSLEHLDKKDRISARLLNNHYIPEFHKAVKLQKSKTPVEAEVYKLSPHGIYLNLIGEKIQSKLPVEKYKGADLKPGDRIKVLITYIGDARITVEPATAAAAEGQ